MRRLKSKTILAGVLVFLLTFGGTLAYIRSMDTKKNDFGIGENRIDVFEDFDPPAEMVPGCNVYKKKIEISNTGNTDTFVRVFLDFSNIEAIEHSFVATSAPSALSPDLGVYTDGMTDGEKEAARTAAEAEILAAGYSTYDDFWTEGGPDNGWVFIPESAEEPELGGFFYYTQAIAPGEKTGDLIHSICSYFPDSADIKPYQVIVYAESIQVYDKEGNMFADSEWKNAWEEYTARKATPSNV